MAMTAYRDCEIAILKEKALSHYTYAMHLADNFEEKYGELDLENA